MCEHRRGAAARYIIKLTHPSTASTNSLHPRAVVNVPTCTRHLNDLPTTLDQPTQTFANTAKSKRPTIILRSRLSRDFTKRPDYQVRPTCQQASVITTAGDRSRVNYVADHFMLSRVVVLEVEGINGTSGLCLL